MTDANGKSLPRKIAIPTGDDFAAHMFLAVAASKVRHRGKLEFVFERETMQPMIANPPYIQALEQFLALARFSEANLSPADSMRSFFVGEAAIAIGWPSKRLADMVGDDLDPPAFEEVKLVRLPGNEQWYDFGSERWLDTQPQQQRVELIGFQSVQASILKSAAYPTTVYKFLTWLGDKQISASIFSQSKNGSPTRSSHLGNPLMWTGDILNVENADAFDEITREIQEEPVFMLFPRIRGTHEYLDVLSSQLRLLMGAEIDVETSHTALMNVANEWDEITNRHDREQQKKWLQIDSGL